MLEETVSILKCKKLIKNFPLWIGWHKTLLGLNDDDKPFSHLNMKVLVNTQKLTIDFCVKYVLNEDFAQCNEEVDLLTVDYVTYNQPHLDEAKLLDAYYKF